MGGKKEGVPEHYFIRPKEKWNGGEWRWDFSDRELMLPDGVGDEVASEVNELGEESDMDGRLRHED
jgi:hypothetical protein